MIISDTREPIQAFPVGMKTKQIIAMKMDVASYNVVHFNDNCDITIEDEDGNETTFSFKAGMDIALDSDVKFITTTGLVTVG